MGTTESCHHVESSSNIKSEGFLQKVYNGESRRHIEKREHCHKIESWVPRQSNERTRGEKVLL
ncbi:uncharacterized protein LACBIDRAFT_299531 [Laccaria bicolor S238N-H82]|uniref:Predicted protein n=1 Tax=Laccaria bicolor (strain S238N-H82 / ATCC MYA-4686) TaxID=486041 RepID=B0DZ07_LACBS|nr:uncharacterized protein LACBIDRAFT_314681 [Laccaria bicolor S238N-H82]XP_001890830.1 uncharacterized protein LACBIDRAFT_299531 [Laccaria bicolor S238N-H82]EDQ98525.1 predicted protein [Laccaria bicolor S238N-H82]EDR00149.1 predicted protein [Laccaria bicolor S238N-H82]|eukprot:XP_001889206.1 predicted protein [Laccaria bicolor S238N-H82]